MDEKQRTRILLLLMAGVLLIGGSLLWVNTHREGPDDVAMQQNAQLEAVLARRKKAAKMGKNRLATKLNKQGAAKMMAEQENIVGAAAAGKSAISYDTGPAKTATNTSPQTKAALQTDEQPPVPVARLTAAHSLKEKLQANRVQAVAAAVVAATAVNRNAPANAAGAVPVAAQQPQAPAPKQVVAATPMAVAVDASKKEAGRKNPFDAVSGFKPFPRAGASAVADSGDNDEDNGEAPAPPKGLMARKVLKAIKGKSKTKGARQSLALVPPPPPVSPSLADSGVPLDELPAPPSRPSIADKMKVMAVIGDHVVMAWNDKKAQLDNNWPTTVTLGPGERFQSVSLVKVSDDSVTLDDDGERMVKSLDPIK